MITVVVTDKGGITTAKTATVLVPHDKSNDKNFFRQTLTKHKIAPISGTLRQTKAGRKVGTTARN